MIDNQFKQKLYETCLLEIDKKLIVAQDAVDRARNSANEEERSTAGDKYDTARAMAHIDQDMFSRQLTEVAKLKNVLQGIDIGKQYEQVQSGALVLATDQLYFIAVSLGMVRVEDKSIMIISPISPIAQTMLELKVGHSFNFNKKAFKIENIW